MPSSFAVGSDTIVQRKSDIVFSALDSELLAIDAQAGYCYSLNDVAGNVWDLIEHPTPVSAVCSKLREKYLVAESTCLQDVIELLNNLAAAGLIRICEKQSV